jgi:hypothetical protein
LQVPYHPPKAYLLRAVVERVGNMGYVRVGLASGTAQFHATVDGWSSTEKKNVSGFDMIEGKNIVNRAEAHRGRVLRDGKPVAILCSVAGQVEMAEWCDGQLLDRYSGSSIGLNWGPTSDRRTLFLTVWKFVQFHELELTPLGPGGDSKDVWPISPDWRAVAWAHNGNPSDKPGVTTGSLNGSDKIDGRQMSELCESNVKVRSIDVSGRGFVDDNALQHLEGLTELEELNLSNTTITDSGLVHLDGIKSLKKLDLSGTKVTQAGIEKLKRALPECEIVWQGEAKSSGDQK